MASSALLRAVLLGLAVSAAVSACGGGSDLVDSSTGILKISIATTGTAPDPDGYTVQVDTDPAQSVEAVGEITATVSAGSHTVRLDGVAANCVVSDDNPRQVTVTAGTTTPVDFTIACSSTTGSVEITTVTTGSFLDSDGYTLSVDGGASRAIGVNETVTVGGLPPGTHTLSLSGVAGNCQVDAGNGRTVEVTAGNPATATFSIACTATPIAFSSNASGLQAVFLVNPDGSGLRNLTADGDFESTPAWSPDGSRILFSKDDGLWVMSAAGSGRTRLVSDAEGVVDYRWSPDGGSIAYVALVRVGQDVIGNLWVMRADGTGKTKLATNSEQPSWSPDSRRIAYTNFADLLDVHIRIINAEGTGDGRLTAQGTNAFEPAWSPDATRIAFVTLGANDIVLVNPDGSDILDLTRGQAEDDGPTWSPDGGKIAFNTETSGSPLAGAVAVMNRDGSGRTSLTNLGGFNLGPSWSQDGSGIVFTSTTDGDSEIYVMNADGSGQKNLSNRPASEDTEPDWSGYAAGTGGAVAAGASLRRWQVELCGKTARCRRGL